MWRLALLAVLLLVAGCGPDTGSPPLPLSCTESPKAITAALAAAPGEVRLEDGTPLSQCVARARTDADLQTLGLTLTRVAEDLEGRQEALKLGYLIGAARRGAPGDSQIQTELVRRLERSGAAIEDGAALEQGIRAGQRGG